MSRSKIYNEPIFFKSAPAKGEKPRVDREGGKFNAGLISGFAVITAGVEALGHEAWVDEAFAASVGEQLAETGEKGLKSRFTHPNASSDSLSRGLGRVTFEKMDDGKVVGSLHLYQSAHNTPDGDLAGFVMTLAEEDPEGFGSSIVFSVDQEAMEEFASDNKKSPDKSNTENYPHVRLKSLKFVDIVDQPAANPDGLFRRDDTFAEAESMLKYALGLTDTKPETNTLGVGPERLAGFVTRFLHNEGLEIVKSQIKIAGESFSEAPVEDVVVEAPEVEAPVVETPVEEAPVAEVTEEDAPAEEAPVAETETEVTEPKNGAEGRAFPEPAPVNENPTETKPAFSELGKYVEEFGAELGSKWILEGKSYSEAQSAYIAKLKADNKELATKIQIDGQTSDQDFSASKPNDGNGKSFGSNLSIS